MNKKQLELLLQVAEKNQLQKTPVTEVIQLVFWWRDDVQEYIKNKN